jgi:hypothetical protein
MSPRLNITAGRVANHACITARLRELSQLLEQPVTDPGRGRHLVRRERAVHGPPDRRVVQTRQQRQIPHHLDGIADALLAEFADRQRRGPQDDRSTQPSRRTPLVGRRVQRLGSLFGTASDRRSARAGIPSRSHRISVSGTTAGMVRTRSARSSRGTVTTPRRRTEQALNELEHRSAGSSAGPPPGTCEMTAKARWRNRVARACAGAGSGTRR